MKLPTFLMAGTAILLSGCAGSPKVKPPELSFEIPSDIGKNATGAVSANEWLATFQDKALEAYVEKVLEHNNSILIAFNNLKIAEQQAIINGAEQLPQISASFSPGRYRSNSENANGSVTSTTYNNHSLGLSVSWELDVWGKVRNSVRAAKADFEEQEELFEDARLSLVANAAKTYYSAIRAYQLYALAQTTFESYSRTANIIQSQYESGTSDALDLRLALANRESAQVSLQSAKIAYESALRSCEVLAGDYPDAAFQNANTFPALIEKIPSAVSSEVLARRYDIKAAERAFAASQQRAVRARKDMLPSLSLTGSAGTSSDELENLLKSDFFVWNLVGNLSQPIFRGGQLKAQSEIAKLNEDTAALTYAQTVLDAFTEVEQTLNSEGYLRIQETAALKAAEQNMASEELAWDQYASGISDIITVLETQRRNLSAQTTAIEAQYSRIENRLNLYLALGGSY
jgi:NodT family efflux transporter outer membrane factor (OMF) lipoprotein